MSDFSECYDIIGDGIAVMKPEAFRKNPKAQKSIREMRGDAKKHQFKKKHFPKMMDAVSGD